METVFTIIAKIFSPIIMPAWKFISEKIFRPKIKLSKAPKNILEHIVPSSSKERIKDLLGSPHIVIENTWIYSFVDACVQIEFWEDSGAKIIKLGIKGNTNGYKFKIPLFTKPLGELTFADIIQEDGQLIHRTTARTDELLFTARLGRAGAWLDFTFGALMPFSKAEIYETNFEWDIISDTLNTAPEDILVNWIGISNGQCDAWFDWSF